MQLKQVKPRCGRGLAALAALLWVCAAGCGGPAGPRFSSPAMPVAFSPDGAAVAAGFQCEGESPSSSPYVPDFEFSQVLTLSIQTGRTLAAGSVVSSRVWSVAFSPDGSTLASGHRDKRVRLWEVQTLRLQRRLEGHGDDAVSVAFAPDGQSLASAGSGDGTVRLWDAATGQPRHTLRPRTGRASAVAFAPDGRWVVGAVGDKVHVWDAAAGTLARTLAGHRGDVLCVAFSGDGVALASGGRDRTLRLWDVGSGETRHVIAHGAEVRSVAFATRGTLLASAGGGVRLWDGQTGAPLRELSEPVRDALSVAVSPDGQWLATGHEDCRVRLWDAQTGQPKVTP